MGLSLKFYDLSLRQVLYIFRDSGELSLSDLTMTSNLALKTLRKCSVKIGKERMKQRRGSKSEEEEDEEKNTGEEEDDEKNTKKSEEEEDDEKKTNMSSSEKSCLELPDPEASAPSVAGTPDND